MDSLINCTALHTAAKSNDLEAAELLLREGVDIFCKDEQGLTPLHVLLRKKIEMFDSLHEKKNEETSDSDLDEEEDSDEEKDSDEEEDSDEEKDSDEKEEPVNDLPKKVEENERFLYLILTHKSAEKNCSEDLKLLKFYAACTMKNSSMAERFSHQVVDINQCVGENSPIYPGYTALHFASHSSADVVKMLVWKGANLLTQDTKGITPLQICIKSFGLEDLHSILTMAPECRNVIFSNRKTKLVDYILSLCDPDRHKKFLRSLGKKVVVSLPKDSPLWPGFTILHLAVTLLPESNCQIIQDILTANSDIITMQDKSGSTPVHLAFRQNKPRVVKLLLQHQKTCGTNRNPVDSDNLSHLHITAAVNNETLTKSLLKNETHLIVAYTGAPLATVKPGWTPLHTAAYTGHTDLAGELLQRGANFMQTDSQGFTAVHLLINRKYLWCSDGMIEFVFASAQFKECIVEGVGLTHLHVASWFGDTKAIERLLDMGSDIEATIGQLEDEQLAELNGCRPIHLVMISDSTLDAYKLLLRRGADILAKKSDGSSVLSELLTGMYDKDYVEPIVDLLWSSEKLQRRCEKELGLEIIHVVCYALDKEKLRELLKREIDVNARVGRDSSLWPGFTPLHFLASGVSRQGEAELLQDRIDELCGLLVGKGADLTLSDVAENTPVITALKDGYSKNGYALASCLLKHQREFNFNPINKYGMTHFHAACLLLEVEIAEEFLKNVPDLDVNQQISLDHPGNFAGNTALILTLSRRVGGYDKADRQIAMVNLLLERGADVDAVDAFGWTALHELAECKLIRNVLLHKILSKNSNINKRTNNGKTSMEILLSSRAPINEVYYFAREGAWINSYNPVSDVGYMAIILDKYVTQKCSHSPDPHRILNLMLDSSDISEVSETGRNAIHNAVAGKNKNKDSDCKRYVGIIEKLMKSGCDIFQQDVQGRTALHLAVKFQNDKAVEALLECGADVNIADSSGKSPFSYASETRKKKNCSDSNAYVCKALAAHLRKLQLVGLQVSELNEKLLSEVLSTRKKIYDGSKEEALIEKLEEAKKIEMYDGGFTLRDFLHPTSVVNSYSATKQVDRDTFDSFFKTDHYRRVYELKSFVKLQHNNARQRPSLIEPTVKALSVLSGFPVPDLCVDIIIKGLLISG